MSTGKIMGLALIVVGAGVVFVGFKKLTK